MTSWLSRWAAMIASGISGSGSSSPNPSIMTMAFSVLATIRSRSLSSSSSAVGNGDELAVDPAQPDGADRAEERDPGQEQRGRGADHREDVGVVLAVGRDRPGLDLDLVADTYSGKSGRIGRSISREVRISLVVGRPSRLMKPPGNLPAA